MYCDFPDHPVVRNCERSGYPSGKEPEYPHCPVCLEPETCEVYVDREDGVVGCESCVTRQSAEQVQALMQSGADGPVCPICGQECEYAYVDRDGDVLGCDECVSARDAWPRDDCFYDGRDD